VWKVAGYKGSIQSTAQPVDVRPWKIQELWVEIHVCPCFRKESLPPLLSHPILSIFCRPSLLQLHSCQTYCYWVTDMEDGVLTCQSCLILWIF